MKKYSIHTVALTLMFLSSFAYDTNIDRDIIGINVWPFVIDLHDWSLTNNSNQTEIIPKHNSIDSTESCRNSITISDTLFATTTVYEARFIDKIELVDSKCLCFDFDWSNRQPYWLKWDGNIHLINNKYVVELFVASLKDTVNNDGIQIIGAYVVASLNYDLAPIMTKIRELEDSSKMKDVDIFLRLYVGVERDKKNMKKEFILNP